MKLSLRSVALLVSSFLTAASLFAQAKMGGANGGGGNNAAAEFSDIAVKTLEAIEAVNPVTKVYGKTVKIRDLVSIAKKMKVTVSKKPLYLAETAVEAINYPSRQAVEFYEARWDKLLLHGKQRLVVHEVLGLARIDDTNYTVSRQLVKIEEPCRTHGCDRLREARVNAVFDYINQGSEGDDGCLTFNGLLSLEALSDGTYKVVCGNGQEIDSMILEIQKKPGIEFDGLYEDENGKMQNSFFARQVKKQK